MTTDTHLSIVIPVYNGWAYLKKLLRTLGAPDGTTEVIVVDDCSPENELLSIERDFPWVRTIHRDQNGGFAAAVNTGIAASNGNICAILNSDLIVGMADVVKLAQVSKASHAIVGPSTVRANGQSISTYFPFPNALIQPIDLTPIRSVVRVLTASAHGRIRDGWLVGSLLVFPKTIVDSIGGFDESYKMYSEEVDWQRRARDFGYPRLFVPDVQVIHDETHGASRYSDAASRRHLSVWKSRARYFELRDGKKTAAVFRFTTCALAMMSISLYVPALANRSLRSSATTEIRRLTAVLRFMQRGEPSV